MKILKIENNAGYYYSFSDNSYVEIDKINSDSLLKIVNYVLNKKDAECDPYEETQVLNKAQQVVYKDISAKISDLIKKREAIINEIDSKYNPVVEKYK